MSDELKILMALLEKFGLDVVKHVNYDQRFLDRKFIDPHARLRIMDNGMYITDGHGRYLTRLIAPITTFEIVQIYEAELVED